MNAYVQFASLTTRQGKDIPLRAMHFRAKVNDIALEMTVEQEYLNNENKPIEAVYTFPLPNEALLLGMDAQIGERFLKGTARLAELATTQYEDAIEQGNSAILLERTNNGLYTANIGNIAPQEKVSLTFRYSLMHSFDGKDLRICIPTVIGNRYGKFSNLGRPHSAEPITDIFASNVCDFSLLITGDLAKTRFTCPSHIVHRTQTDEGIFVTIPNAVADRDFIFLWQLEDVPELRVAKGLGPEDTVVCASLVPQNLPIERSPLEIYLLLDCSGSMQGISMEQTQKACGYIVNSLKENDRFNIARFGSDVRFLFSRAKPVSQETIEQATQFIRTLNCDMGGTEIEKALAAVYQRASRENTVILLVTDGDIWPTKTLSEVP